MIQFLFGPQLAQSSRDLSKLRSIMDQYSFIFIFFAFLIMGSIFSLGKTLPLIIYPNQYSDCFNALLLLTISGFLFFLASIFLAPLIYTHFQKQYLIIVGLSTLVNIACNLILIPLYSYQGAALATIFSNITMLILAFIRFKKSFYIPFSVFSYFMKIFTIFIPVQLLTLLLFTNPYLRGFIFLLLFTISTFVIAKSVFNNLAQGKDDL
jgi:O-antigen/teichoic acid export membrane protein